MVTAGLDLGDNYTYLCLLDIQSGEVLEEGRVRTTPEAFKQRFDSEQQQLRIAIEVGTHSPWVSRPRSPSPRLCWVSYTISCTAPFNLCDSRMLLD